MKIALVAPMMISVPPKTYGGIQLIVADLAKGLAKKGHEVTVFCSGDSTIRGKNITRVKSSPYATNFYMEENREWEKKQLLDVVKRQNEFDIIHLHYEPAVCRFTENGKEFDLNNLFSVPLVFTFHNSTSITEHIKYYRRNALLKKHNFVFVSKNQRKPLKFLPNSNVIYNALAIEKFPFSKKKENFLLFLGRITPSKGILEAITVAKKTLIPLIILAQINPSDTAFYENEVKPNIDGKLIKFLGEANFSKKVKYLKKASCLLFPILWEEPFGLVMIEALVCGTPVVAFKRGSVPEVIKNNVTGLIVNNIDEMINVIKKVGTIIPEKCRESVLERFSTSRMVDEYENLFKKIIKKKNTF